MANEKAVEYRVENGVAPVNSYTHELLRELDDTILQARFDDNVNVLVLTGKVEKFFSAGADINMLSNKPLSFKNNFALHGHEVLMRLENTPKLVIAAINGHAVGGGLEIAMACDIRIARKEGGRMGLAEINLGVMPGMGGTQRLPRLVGPARAKELIWSGRQVRADEALAIGLVDRVVPAAEVEEAALAWAAELASGAVVAMGLAKQAIDDGLDGSLERGLDIEARAFVETFATEDAKTGVASFLEHGPGKAQFQGR
jgi:enoyl-CoA hydratase